MSTDLRGPTVERGQSINAGGLVSTVMPWTSFLDDRELTPEMQWPRSIESFDVMRTDSQIAALMAGFTMPIYRYRWMLDPNGASATTVARASEDLNLPIVGKKEFHRGRAKRRFSFQRHMREAIGFSMIWGHMYFEQVGEDDGSAWRLRKLAGRMPYTINEIAVERDGGLRYIKQNLGPQAPELPVNNLVAYVQNQEPGNWVGRSWLRELYKHWLIKDRLYRVDAMKHERNGMGVPIIEAPQGASAPQMAELNNLAMMYKVGDASGGALPYGAKLRLVGTEGMIPDTLASIREHDQAMARRFMLMLMQLGQTETGSRALGSEFADYVGLGQQTLAQWFCDVFNEHVIEDQVDWSDGEDAPAPLLVYDCNEDPDLSVADFALLVTNKILSVDEELEDYAREKYSLPERTAPRPAPVAPPDVPGTAPGEPTAPPPPDPTAASASAVPLPSRKLRRAPTALEMAAQVNFAALDTAVSTGVEQLVRHWEANVKPAHIQELGAAIRSAKKLDDVTKIQATALGQEELLRILREGAAQGITQASLEAQAQGVQVKAITVDEIAEGLAQRANAMADLMARSISEAGARNGSRMWTNAGNRVATAGKVESYLAGLTDAFLQSQFNGLYMAGLNAGRVAAMRSAEGEAQTIFASELLDSNTCDTCMDIDGQVYESLDDAAEDYSAGGYNECLGGPNCRGTIVVEYAQGVGPGAGGLEF